MREHDEVLAALADLDARIRPAVDEVEADFGIDYAEPEDDLLWNVELPYLSDSRRLANLLGWRLLLHVHEGRNAEAASATRRLIGLGDAIDSGHPVLVGHMVSLGVKAVAAQRLARVVPHMTVGEGGLPREDAVQLIELLLNDEALREGWRAAVQGEILLQQNAVDYLLQGGDGMVFHRRLNLLEKILLVLTAPSSGVTMIELMTPLLTMAEPDRLPREALDELDGSAEHIILSRGDMLAAFLVPSLDRGIKSSFRLRNANHRAAVAMALMMFRQDEGDLPATLEDLVPDYLPRVPVDTLTADEMVKYDARRGIIWTVGRDGIDHGGISVNDRLRENPDRTSRQTKELGTDEVTRVRLPE